MYLARRFVNNHLAYSLCESYRQGDLLCNRVLMDLGANPGRFIIYPGGNSFYIDQEVEERLHDLNVEVDQDILEELFMPFVDPGIRAKIEPFMARQETIRRQPMDDKARQRIAAETHLFDRRRLHFLRCGRTDPGRLQNFVSPLFRILLDKSRDEIEQYFLAHEGLITPRDYSRYIFSIFDLQRHFPEHLTRTQPQALPQEELDVAFLSELCRLDGDADFWSGMERGQRLPNYLVRYLVMYFDFSTSPSGRGPYLNDFTSSGSRFRRPSRPTGRMSRARAGTIFGVAEAELRTMSRRELTRLYRKRAHELHPDKGGDDKQFIDLTTAYHELLRGRR